MALAGTAASPSQRSSGAGRRRRSAGTGASGKPSRIGITVLQASVPTGLAALLVWAPIPLGSNRPWSWSLLAVAAGLLLGAWCLRQALAPAALRVPLVVKAAAVATALVWAFAFLQTLPAEGLAPLLEPHPFWAEVQSAGLAGAVPLAGLDAAEGRSALLRLMAYAAVFWLAFAAAQDSAQARRLLLAVVGAATACAAYGLLAYFGRWGTILGYPKTAYLGDVTGTFVNRNNFATFANLGLVACLALLAEPFLKARSEGGGGAAKRVLAGAVERLLGGRRVFLLVALAVLATAVLQSHSRGGMLSGAAAIVVLLFLAFLVTRPRPAVALAVALTVGGLGWGILQVSGAATLERLNQVDSETDIEGFGRFSIWQVSARLVAERPWTGHGYGNYEPAFATARDERFTLQVDKAHQTYLEHLVELGVPATVLLYLGPVLLLCYCCRGLFVRRRNLAFPLAALVAGVLVGLHALVDFSLQIPAVAVTFAALLGIGVAQAMPSPAAAPLPGASLRE